MRRGHLSPYQTKRPFFRASLPDPDPLNHLIHREGLVKRHDHVDVMPSGADGTGEAGDHIAQATNLQVAYKGHYNAAL